MTVWFVIANKVETSIHNRLNECPREWSHTEALCSCENEEGISPQVHAVMPSLYYIVIKKTRQIK